MPADWWLVATSQIKMPRQVQSYYTKVSLYFRPVSPWDRCHVRRKASNTPREGLLPWRKDAEVDHRGRLRPRRRWRIVSGLWLSSSKQTCTVRVARSDGAEDALVVALTSMTLSSHFGRKRDVLIHAPDYLGWVQTTIRLCAPIKEMASPP